MKKATFFKKLNKNRVQCLACNHYCQISPGKYGLCGVRKNVDGELYLVVYGKAAALHIDPIEKKPLYHFLPGTEILSLGTVGCNFRCSFCQNYDLSQGIKKNVISKESSSEKSHEPRGSLAKLEMTLPYLGEAYSPKNIVDLAVENNLPSIAYTYNEPTIFVEYALDTMKLARKKGLKNVWVSNGYISKEAFAKVAPYLDAINIDLKSFSEKFYRTVCGASLQPVLENIKKFYQAGVHVELTTLVIEGQNDDDKEIKLLVDFIKSVSPEIPWHISRFFPAYKMLNAPVTSLETLERIKKLGEKAGLRHIHIGNV